MLCEWVAAVLCAACLAQTPAPPSAPPKSDNGSPAAEPLPATRRTELNLLGSTDAARGESRRNENVQFNLVDNNALKELNVRLGTTATLVEEFRPERGYFGVEFGNQPPATAHLAPEKRTSFHGSLHQTHGNSVFQARSFFQAGPVRPAHENQYGFRLGAQPWRDAFVSLEAGQQKIRGNVNGNILTPKPEERIPLTTDPGRRAVVLRFLSAFPAAPPNRTDIDARALNTNALQSIDDNRAGALVDQGFGDRTRLLARYDHTSQYVDAFQLLAGQNPDTATRVHTARLTVSRQWSAETLGAFSIGFDRIGSLLVGEPNAVGPSVNFSGVIERLGPPPLIPINRAQNRVRFASDLHGTRARHTWVSGWEAARRQLNGSETSSHRGTLTFRDDFGRDAMTNFRLGIPSRFSGAVGNTHRGFRSWDLQFYGGDTWRAGANFTLNFGLRFEPVARPHEVNGLNQVPYNCDCNNLAPRFGFAWRLPQRWGVLRAAYGLHYGEIFPITFSQVRYNPPGNVKFEIVTPELAMFARALAASSFDPNARSAIFQISPELAAPYSHQYNFSWEPFDSARWKLQLGYVGSRSHKLLYLWYTNRARPVDNVAQTTSTVNQRRPDASRFDVRKIINGSRGYFDAGRVSLVVPRWRGLSFETSYWLSKAIDLGAGYSNTGTGEDGRQSQSQSEFLVHEEMKGPSVFDHAHAFLARGAYLTPAPPPGWGPTARWLGRWDLSMVVLAKSGTPFTVISGSDAPGFGNVDGDNGDRPHLVDPSVLGRAIAHPDGARRRLPRSAFAFISPLEARGNLGSNTFRKNGIANVNASLGRVWALGAEKKLGFRAESINLLNTPQFAEPTRELTSASFGAITNTLNEGRTFRFRLKLDF